MTEDSDDADSESQLREAERSLASSAGISGACRNGDGLRTLTRAHP